ncbi:MAG: hypothetical protein R6U13_16435 [Desulfatiglandaceae bacterium]
MKLPQRSPRRSRNPGVLPEKQTIPTPISEFCLLASHFSAVRTKAKLRFDTPKTSIPTRIAKERGNIDYDNDNRFADNDLHQGE